MSGRSSYGCRGSTTFTTRWPRPRSACRWAYPWMSSPPAWRPPLPPSGAPRRSRSADTALQILLIKNPAGANEILRTLALESDQLAVLAILNDNIADGRDVSWVWDADFELLGSRLRSVVCSGTRAAELAVRLKYAGVPDGGPVGGAGASGGTGSGNQPGCRRQAVRTAHLHGAAGAAGRARVARSGLTVLGERSRERDHLARHRVRPLHRGPSAVAAARG